MDVAQKIVVGISGASGAIYGLRLLEELVTRPFDVHLIISGAGMLVLKHETAYAGEPVEQFLGARTGGFHPAARLHVHDPGDLFAPPASGSFLHAGMAIAPCSMKTLGAVAAGLSDNLMLRAADVCLKEKRPLVLLAREMPLSLIHLKNMCRAAEAGATVMPPSPGFYNRPETVGDLVDSVVGRLLDQLNIAHSLVKRWGE